MRASASVRFRGLPLIAAILALAATGPEAVEGAAWKTLAASGPVTQRTAGTPESVWAVVERGDLLEPLTLVRTGKRGRATLSRHASVLIVDPKSELELPAGGARASVRQTSGSVVYDIDPASTGGFDVETPYLVAGVKGTVFGVTVTERYTMVSVEQGRVEVRDPSGGESSELGAGDAVMVEAGRGLEVLRQGDGRDRERQHTKRTRDRMHRRLRQDNEAAERRAERRETDPGGEVEGVASLDQRDQVNRREDLDEPDEDLELGALDDLGNLDDADEDLLQAEDERQDTRDDLREQGDDSLDDGPN